MAEVKNRRESALESENKTLKSQLVASGHIPGRCDDAHITDSQRLGALVEEVGEVARAMNDAQSPRGELAQVAAVALGWIVWELQ